MKDKVKRDSRSPLDVKGLDMGWSREEVVALVREGRERQKSVPGLEGRDDQEGHRG